MSYKGNKIFKAFLESKSIVIVGYFDKVGKVNLSSLLAIWIDVTQDNGSFSDHYPFAADYFQVTILEKEDPRNEEAGILLRLLHDYRYCDHVQVWIEGEPLDDNELNEIFELIARQRCFRHEL